MAPCRERAGAQLRLDYHAKDVFLVLSGAGRITVYVNRRKKSTIEVAATPVCTPWSPANKLTPLCSSWT